MKRAKKLIALLTAATVMLATVLTVSAAEDFGALKVSNKNFAVGITNSEYPQVEGMSSLNSKIVDNIDKFNAKYSHMFVDLTDGIVIETNIEDDHDVFSKIEITLSLYSDPKKVSAETFTYYIDKSDYSEISEEDYEAGLNAPEEEEAEETEEAAEAEAVELTDEQLASMVPLRANLEPLGFGLGWNPELAAVEILWDEDIVAVLFIGEDIYVVGDMVVELGIAPELGEDELTYVPVAFFTEIIGADPVIDEEGNITGFVFPEIEEAVEDEAVEDEVVEEEAAE